MKLIEDMFDSGRLTQYEGLLFILLYSSCRLIWSSDLGVRAGYSQTDIFQIEFFGLWKHQKLILISKPQNQLFVRRSL